jgi:DNA-binding PadR family transcriptional regulator
VPKGMLRHLTLKILEKQPMSGSELMDQIEGYTDWRPSPGSIYPLLAHLQKENLIEPHVDKEPSLKRFKLSKNGIQMLEDHGHHNEQITKRHRTMHKMYWILHREMPDDLYESFLNLMNAIEETYDKTTGNKDASERFKKVLDMSSKRLAEIGV